jgi:glycerol-3-phosphate dehydrogenase
MNRNFKEITNSVFDIAIIGGGVYGVWLAFHGALQGLKVCLFEMGDFGSATSANSLKIIHGGLRYLQHLDFLRMRQSITERRTLMKLAPHLLKPIPFILPTYGHGLKGIEAFSTALLMNDIIGFDRNKGIQPDQYIPRGKTMNKSDTLILLPECPGDDISGAALWYDYLALSTDRLLLSILLSAVRAGAFAFNYTQVIDYLYKNDTVSGLKVCDKLQNKEYTVHSKVVINASGPWVDNLLGLLPKPPSEQTFHPSKGINLITKQIFSERAVGLQGTNKFKDNDEVFSKGYRLFFIVPWNGYSLIGTKHLAFDKNPSKFRIEKTDVQTFLEEINAAYPPLKLTENDVIGVYGGMLPEKPVFKRSQDVQLEKHSRIIDHQTENGIKGLVTVIGVKWTTARLVAEKALELARKKLGKHRNYLKNKNFTITGGDFKNLSALMQNGLKALPTQIPGYSKEHILRTLGSDYTEILKYMRDEPHLRLPVTDASPVTGAQLIHAVRAEMACHLDDIIMRRTDIVLSPDFDERVVAKCGQVIASHFKWSKEKLNEEIQHTCEATAKLRMNF